MTRREFLKGNQSKKNVIPIIRKEKCTGCGLCAMDCPTEALTVLQTGKEDIYQILFRHDLCNACAHCVKSCPEQCLQLKQRPQPMRTDQEAKVIFEDKISKCIECGTLLFPEAMVKNLKSKIFLNREPAWSFNLCPSCRIKIQFESERVGKSEIPRQVDIEK